MATSEKTSKSAAPSTPAAQPAASHAAAESDALPSRGAVRGDMLGIKDLLAAELDQRSDGQTDESGADAGDAEAAEEANLDQFDEQQAAEAADATGDEGGEGDLADTGDEGEGAEGAEGEADSDAAESDEAPESEEQAAEGEEGDKPKTSALQQRFNELTARAKGTEEQLAAANERLAAYEARDAGMLSPDELDHIDTAEDLTKAQQRYSNLLQWAIKNPDGGKLGDKEYDADGVREIHAEVQRLMTEAVPARREFLAARQTSEADAVTVYPWLKDRTKGAGALVQKAIQNIPALRRLPNHRMLAADAFVGQVLRSNGILVTDALVKRLAQEAQAAGKAKPAPGAKPAAAKARPGAKPPAAPGRAGVLPPRLNPRAAAAKQAGRKLRSGGGTEDDLADSIAAKL